MTSDSIAAQRLAHTVGNDINQDNVTNSDGRGLRKNDGNNPDLARGLGQILICTQKGN